MMSSRAQVLVAFGGWFLLACGSARETSLPASAAGAPAPGGAAPSPTPDPMSASNASVDVDARDGEPASAAPSPEPASEGVAGELPIANDPGAAAPGEAETGADGEGTMDPATAPAASEGTTDGSEPTATPGEPVPPAPGGEAPVTPPDAELPAITLWIAGDSTVANGNTPCPRGWGRQFAPHFTDNVSITNSAAGGRSVHTWLYQVQTVMDETGECALTRGADGEPLLQPRWQAMLDGMKAGDYLFIQFGINDGDPTCDRHVGIDAFITAYGMMAAAAQERGAQPIFLTPVSSIACDGANARGSRGGFVPATLDAGARFGVPVIDLHARSVELYQERAFCPVAGGDVSAATTGPVGDFFCDDHTHFSEAGAVEIADLVAQALVDQQIPLAAYLR